MAILLRLMEKSYTTQELWKGIFTWDKVPFPNPHEWCRIFSISSMLRIFSPTKNPQEILKKNSTFSLRMAGEIQENQNLQRISKGELLSPHHCKVVDKTKVWIQGSAWPQISSVGWCGALASNQNRLFSSIFVWWFLEIKWFLKYPKQKDVAKMNSSRCARKKLLKQDVGGWNGESSSFSLFFSKVDRYHEQKGDTRPRFFTLCCHRRRAGTIFSACIDFSKNPQFSGTGRFFVWWKAFDMLCTWKKPTRA